MTSFCFQLLTALNNFYTEKSYPDLLYRLELSKRIPSLGISEKTPTPTDNQSVTTAA